MAKGMYQVRVMCTKTRTWVIEADSDKEAKEKALEYARAQYCSKESDKARISSFMGPFPSHPGALKHPKDCGPITGVNE